MLHVVLKNGGRELTIQGQGCDVGSFIGENEGTSRPTEARGRSNPSSGRDCGPGGDTGEAPRLRPSGRICIQWLEGQFAKLAEDPSPEAAESWRRPKKGAFRREDSRGGAVPISLRQQKGDMGLGGEAPGERGRSTGAGRHSLVRHGQLGNHGSAEEQWEVPPRIRSATHPMVEEQPKGLQELGRPGTLAQGLESGIRLASPLAHILGTRREGKLDHPTMVSLGEQRDNSGRCSRGAKLGQARPAGMARGRALSSPVFQARVLERNTVQLEAHRGTVATMQVPSQIRELQGGEPLPIQALGGPPLVEAPNVERGQGAQAEGEAATTQEREGDQGDSGPGGKGGSEERCADTLYFSLESGTEECPEPGEPAPSLCPSRTGSGRGQRSKAQRRKRGKAGTGGEAGEGGTGGSGSGTGSSGAGEIGGGRDSPEATQQIEFQGQLLPSQIRPKQPDAGQEPVSSKEGMKGKPGLLRTLKQAGLDSRGETQAPLAHEFEKNPGTSGHGCKGGEEVRTSPTRAQNHDPFAIGKLKKWLDGLRAHYDGQGATRAERWKGLAPDLKEVSYWVRGVTARSDWESAIETQSLADQDLWLRLIDLHCDRLEAVQRRGTLPGNG